jgi:transposase
MRETQEVESLRFAEAPLYPTPGGEPSELKETRLLGMQLQTKLREPFAESDASNEEIARRSGVDSDAVRRWRARFSETGVEGVGVIAKGRGRKSWLPAGTVAEVLRLTQHERPADGATQWSTRTLGKRVGIGKDAIARIWADHSLKPWKVAGSRSPTTPLSRRSWSMSSACT